MCRAMNTMSAFPIYLSASIHRSRLLKKSQSPGDSYKELLDKAAYYLANGTRLVWFVYPEKKLIEALSSDSRQLLDINDTLDGGDVLPGFTIAVKAIFAE